jgi:hypoxanthine phosphoribosyltransferase
VERETMTWDDLGTGSRDLAETLLADDWIPDLVLGISRGGLLIAGALAYALGVKNTATISVEFYTGIDFPRCPT